MGTYNWVTANNIGDDSGTADPTTAWCTPSGLALRTLSCPSPVGEGDVLVRTEVSVELMVQTVNLAQLVYFAGFAASQFIGDVGIHDGETIDPTVAGEGNFAFTWDGGWSIFGLAYGPSVSEAPAYMRCSTRGYVTSKARRGPESYGAVDPAFNLSVVTHASDWYPLSEPDTGSSWVITARCLWFTP